jgi:hypothetical protein
MKICPVGAKLFHVDRWTDVTKLIITLCNFVNMPNNTCIASSVVLRWGNPQMSSFIAKVCGKGWLYDGQNWLRKELWESGSKRVTVEVMGVITVK